jgi:hypothetical protein
MTVKIKDAFGNEHEVLGTDDLKTLNDDIGKRFEGFKSEQTEMITGLGTRLKKDLTGGIGAAVGEALKPTLDAFETKLKSELQPPARQDEDDKSKDSKGNSKADKSDDPQVVELKKQIAQLTKQSTDLTDKFKAAEEKANAEMRARADLNLRQTLRKELGKRGISTEEAAEAAELFLYDGKKRVGYSEDGETLVYKDPEKGELPLSQGLETWIKTAEAKLYLPPVGASGSGEKPGQKAGLPPASGEKRSPQETVGNALMNLLSQ